MSIAAPQTQLLPYVYAPPPPPAYAAPPPHVAYFMPTQTAHQNKKRKSPRDGATVDWSAQTQSKPANVPYFGASPNVAMPPAPRFNQEPGAYSNMRKRWNNLFYCTTCGYDVDHEGRYCPDPKPTHNPNVKRDEAHLVPNASMAGQHKMLPDGTGQGKGWILAQAANKGFYTMARQGQQPWAQVFQGQMPGGGGGGPGTGRRRARGRRNGGGGRGHGAPQTGRVDWGNQQGQWRQWSE